MKINRCTWAQDNTFHDYHDTEWGVPVHDDITHFEFITLEGAQAGLSWATILKKRNGYKKAFKNFDPYKVAHLTEKDVAELLNDPDIVRNKLKINSTITNAKSFIKIQQEFGTFDDYIWSFVNNKPIKNKRKSIKELPASTPLSDKLSKDLKRRGFKFVGSTIVYAYMQAVGIVNDHEINCFRYHQI